MDFLSDNFTFVIFIVIAIVVQIGRLFIRNAGRRKREERGEPVEERPEAAVYDRREYEEDEAFSAWNLSIDDENVPAVPVPPAAAPRPVSVPLSAPFPAPAAEKREPAGPLFPAAPEAGPPVTDRRGGQSGRRNKGRTKKGAGFPEKLDYLPPLKRAVVLAEILGAPKGD
jgi:hypothetical protein